MKADPPNAPACDHCGACCTKLIIEIQHVDIVREPRLVPYVRPLQSPDEDPDDIWTRVYGLGRGLGCPMHDGERCTIYPTRPDLCVSVPAGGPTCQRARYFAKLPPLGLDEWPDDAAELAAMTDML